MENLIRDVIELDKKARNEVLKLTKEKEHISDVLREERLRLEKKYKSEAKEKLNIEKTKMLAELEERKKLNRVEFEKSLKELESSFALKSDEWIESIYQDCIKE
ncbi:MAG: hypothetical protein AB7U79_08275 [Candidatus Izemoplasmatales bacterium]